MWSRSQGRARYDHRHIPEALTRRSNGSERADLNGSGDHSSESRSGLDVMLTDASSSSLRRWAPGPEAFKWVAALARNPRQPLSRSPASARSWGRSRSAARRSPRARRTSGSPTPRGRRTRSTAGSARPTSPRRRRPRNWSRTPTSTGAASSGSRSWSRTPSTRSRRPTCRPTRRRSRRRSTPAAATSSAARRRLVHDIRRRPHIPEMVDSSPFTIGENIAVTEGAVVLRTDVIELIQYRPRTEQVHARPLLLVPPMINKYYIADLAERPQHDPVLPRLGPAGLRDQLAQPDRGAPGLEPRHLRPGRARRPGGRRGDHRSRRRTTRPRHPSARPVRRRHHRQLRRRPPRARSASSTASPP